MGGEPIEETRAIEVVAPPRAVPGPSRLVEKVDEPVVLDGRGSIPEGSVSGGWRQIAGPRVPLEPVVSPQLPTLSPRAGGKRTPARDEPSTVSTECPALRCQFTPTETGLYTFELEVRDGPLPPDAKQVSVLVAPPPSIRIGDVRSIEAGSGHMTEIDGSASSDVLDEHPTFRWEVIDRPPDVAGGAVTPNNRPKVMFVGEALGDYTVQLTVCARRHLPGQELWSCETDEVTVTVRRHWVMLFANLAYSASAGQEPAGYDRALSASAGLVVQPFTNHRPELSAIALRFSHPIMRLSVAPEGTSGQLDALKPRFGAWLATRKSPGHDSNARPPTK
jgi:hypothetical protein